MAHISFTLRQEARQFWRHQGKGLRNALMDIFGPEGGIFVFAGFME